MAVIGAFLFGPARSLAWPGAWVFLAIFLLSSVAIEAMLLRRDPDLLAERLRPPVQRGQPAADRVLMTFFGVVFVAWLVFMALDAKQFGWSHVPAPVQIVGAIAVAGDFLVTGRVFRENSFVAPVVKVQTERGQHVVSTGPYAHVRHPMYAGALLLFFGTPLLLGSWWGLIGSVGMTVLLAVRALLEERTLARELDGYDAYMHEVRYRLIPGIW